MPLLKSLVALAAAVGLLPQPAMGPVQQSAAAEAAFTLPSEAREVRPNVFSLGKKADPTTDGTVEGYAFVTPRRAYHHRPDHAGGPGGGGGDTSSTCYATLGRGVAWKSAEPWVADMTNTQNLDPATLFETQAASLAKWESAAAADIFGNGSQASGLSADADSPDGQNEVVFGSIESDGAIAVTIVWGYFSGPPHNRRIVEWDQVYDQIDFPWSLSGEDGKMDFDNIATHENGHAAGLDHPSDTCTEETMYRFGALGETKKRTLEAGDIAGINALY